MLRRRSLAFLVFFSMVATVLPFARPAAAASADIVISQVYGGGGNVGATLKNDFIELFNRGASAMNLNGWSVQYAASTGTTWQKTTLTDITLQPGQYYLVQEAPGAGGTQNLPAPDATGAIPMSATAAKVVLLSNNTTLPTGTSCPSGAAVVDLVGYGSATNCFEGSASAPGLTNTSAALRAAGGCVDIDNNAADFTAGAPTPRNSASPLGNCNDQPPAVSLTTPSAGASGVAVGANISVTFSEPVIVTGTWFTISCSTSGPHPAVATPASTTFSLDPVTDFVGSETCTVTVVAAQVTDQDLIDPPDTMAANYVFNFTTTAATRRIHEIQGAAHRSPFEGQPVGNVAGIVTFRISNGFFMQDPAPDDDPDTSEGIFVFTSSPPSVSVGDSVTVNGSVSEFHQGSTTNLTITELVSPSIAVLSSGNQLPRPTVWTPPSEIIEDDAAGDVETSGVFDPATDGIDYAESLEDMLVEIDDATATGPSISFTSSQTTEVSLVNPDAGIRTPRGGVVIRATGFNTTDFNPERLILQAVLGTLPNVNVGDRIAGATVGVLDYNFGNYKLRPTQPVTFISGGLAKETTAAAIGDQLAVATFNVENLDPSDGPAKFDGLAHVLVDNLRSPDVVALEEVQDNTGPVDDGTVDSDTTLNMLVAAIHGAGGPNYQYRYISPVYNQDGGEPFGNIRVAFLFRTDRGLAFIDRTGAGPLTANVVVGTGAATQLQYSPGRIAPTNTAWTSSRKPLAAEFTFQGHRLFVIGNHFNSKGGDQPLYGHFQPPGRSSEIQRHQQARLVNDFVGQILSADPSADVIVLGDLNDFQFSDTLAIVEAGFLHALVNTLPIAEQYTYDFDGNSQAIDHILFDANLFDHALYAYDIVHVNSEFAVKVSDHEPQVVRIGLPRPTISAARSPAANADGWNNVDVTVTFTCVDPLAALVACPAQVIASAEGRDQSVTGSSALKGGGTVAATITGISVDKTKPVVSYTGNAGMYSADETVHIRCIAADALSDVKSTTCANIDGPAYGFGLGAHTFSASATDYAGNVGEGSTTFTVVVSESSLCTLVRRFVSKDGVATSLCVKLDSAAAARERGNLTVERNILNAFANEVSAQRGKAIAAENANVLMELAARI